MSNALNFNNKTREIYTDAAWLAARIGRIADEAAVRVTPKADHDLGARPAPTVAISREHVFPGPILLDLKTGSYFVYKTSLEAGNEAARKRNLTGGEIHMGTYIVQGAGQNAAVIAHAQGLDEYQLGVARKALGSDKVDDILQSIERRDYFSSDMHAKIFAGLAQQTALKSALHL